MPHSRRGDAPVLEAEARRRGSGCAPSRRLHLLLAPHGLAYLVPRIQETYGDFAHRVVTERPYELTSVFGVGFSTADRIARGLGSPGGDHRAGASGGALHVLSEAERSGSTCLPIHCCLARCEELLGSTPRRAS